MVFWAQKMMPTRMKDLTLLPGFVLRACLSPLSFHTVIKSARLRRGEAARGMAICWSRQRGSGRSQPTRNARAWAGCRRAVHSAHAQAASATRGPAGGGERAARLCRGPVRSCASACPAAAAVQSPLLVTRGMLLLALGGPWAAGLRLGGKRTAPWAATALRGPRAAVWRAASCRGSSGRGGGGGAGLSAAATLLPCRVRAQVGGQRARGPE